MPDQMYGTLEGNPATWIAGYEGWWMPNGPDGEWYSISSSDAAWNGHVMTKADFVQKFPNALAKLPAEAFRVEPE